MRKKEAIDFCVALLFSDEKLCESQHPDMSERINCAYPVLSLLAPVIADFPVVIDASGDIEGDYRQALQKTRDWFSSHQREYEILNTQF
jgi:hypothetical protein